MSNQTELLNALNKIGQQHFKVKDLSEMTNVSEPTVRNFLKNIPLNKVSRGVFQVKQTSEETINTESQEKNSMKETQNPNILLTRETSNGNSSHPQNTEIPADLYIAAYLRGFDAGFKKGWDKAQSQN